MIDTVKLDQAISDCLAEMGHAGARHIVLVNVGETLAVGTNTRDYARVCHMLMTALKMISIREQEMDDCKGSA